jgi:hypothetical protein
VGLDVHHCPVARADGDACAGSATSVDSGSSIEVFMALINVKSPRKTEHWRNGGECHFSVLDQYQ